jgi:LPS sulfotransferase NodH
VHKVVNETQVRRIHLTFDTYGSTAFWQMAKPLGREDAPQFVPYREGEKPRLTFESFVDNPVMTPGDVELEFSRLVADAAAVAGNDPAAMTRLMNFVGWLRNEWRVLWYAVGPTPEGTPQFVRLMQQAMEAAQSIPSTITMASNGRPLMQALPATIAALVKPQAYGGAGSGAPGRPVASSRPAFDRPVFIVSAPRSGSTWLYDMLARNGAFWTLGGEGHHHIEQIAALDPRRRAYDSNRLTAADANAQTDAELRANYLKDLRDAAGVGLSRSNPPPASLRFLEKTPKNALRIPFLKALFPDARFIFLHREAQTNISAIMEAWRSGNFVTYPALPGWSGLPWSMLLIPGWRELTGASLEQIAMRQWRDANEIILDDLAALQGADWCVVRYEDLQGDLEPALRRLCAFADVPFDEGMQKAMQERHRLSRYTLSQPDPQKWRRNEPAVASVISGARGTAERLSGLDRGVSRAG